MRNQLLEPLLSRAVASSHATARWMNGRVDLDLHFRTRHVGLAPRLDLVLSKPKNRPTKRKYSKEQVGKGASAARPRNSVNPSSGFTRLRGRAALATVPTCSTWHSYMTNGQARLLSQP
jgi:hypothetical protein